MVIHPAPIVILNFPITILAIIPKIPDWVLIKVSHGFALFMFWLENIAWLSLFFVYEVMLTPLVYIKTLFVVAWATQGLFMTMWNVFAWFTGGPIYIMFFILRDVWTMFVIFTQHNG